VIGPGTRLGDYEILAPLGAGGMGEVYRARDSQLGRSVAIKVLAPALTHDADRLARFEREARLLASLNHPNIAVVHGAVDVNGGRGLVMELVEGDTLAERIARAARATSSSGRRGLPIDEALPIAHQIIAALDAAHERGIVHRDLKPANVKVTPDGLVKALDFGLAKVVASDSGVTTQQDSHIATIEATESGLLLGTVPYMSPEQARAQAVDRRTDIWAFGCILYEMLTGRMAFAGATTTETLAAILERAPDFGALPPATPPGVHRVLRRCLEKSVKLRLRDIADAQGDLVVASEGDRRAPGPVAAGGRARTAGFAFAAGAALAAVLAAALWPRTGAEPTSPAPVIRFSAGPPAGGAFQREVPTTFVSISPDGTQLAFAAQGRMSREVSGSGDSPISSLVRSLAPKARARLSGRPTGDRWPSLPTGS
jgi:eukaryotic-like serine/threonine-protein kinase